MKVKKESRGSAANAAYVNISIKTGFSIKRVEEYTEVIFNILNIQGKNSYEDLLEALRIEEKFDTLYDSLEIRSDVEEILDILSHLLTYDVKANVKKEKRNNKINETIIDKEPEEIVFNEHNLTSIEDYDFSSCYQRNVTKLNIINCEVLTQELPNKKVFEYIDIEERPYEELQADFSIGDHLLIIDEIVKNEDMYENLLLMCESKETGLIAMKYISTLLGTCADYDDEVKFSDKLPIIYPHMLNIPNSVFGSSEGSNWMFGSQSIKDIDLPKPWWEDYDFIPLILIIDKESVISNNFTKNLKALMEYHDVFIIVEKKSKEKDEEHENEEGIFSNIGFGQNIDEVVNDVSFTLNYNIYEIEEPKITSNYIKTVFEDAVTMKSYKIDEKVDIEEVLKALKKNRNSLWEVNTTIVQLVNRVISMQRVKSNILDNNDFSFLQRKSIYKKNAKEIVIEKPKVSAIDNMNKNIYGLEHVKKALLDTMKTIKISKERVKAGLLGNSINNVFMFYGPPGVGKTEMAKHFGEIMIENELLSGNRFLSINGANLKARYVGHTAGNVRKIFDENDIIFIDECYSVAASNNEMDSFSEEALAELCIQLEKYGKEKLIIFAGYGGDVLDKNNKIREFLDANPGIASRITFNIDFPSYNHREMLRIFEKTVENADYILEEGWEDIVEYYIKEKEKARNYGNAREARKLFQIATTVQAARLEIDEKDVAVLKLISNTDLEKAINKINEGEFKLNNIQKKCIGFM